jgi:hypothetical protein
MPTSVENGAKAARDIDTAYGAFRFQFSQNRKNDFDTKNETPRPFSDGVRSHQGRYAYSLPGPHTE